MLLRHNFALIDNYISRSLDVRSCQLLIILYYILISDLVHNKIKKRIQKLITAINERFLYITQGDGSIFGGSIVGVSIVGVSIVGVSIVGVSIVGGSIVGVSIVGVSIVGVSIVGVKIVGVSIVGV